MAPYSPKQIALLSEIRKCLTYKTAHSPALLSSEEFDRWQSAHRDCFLHRGYLSIWEGIEVPSGCREVAIEKKRVRNGAKPYLVFEDAGTFHAYCQNVRLLGVEAFALLEDRFAPQIRKAAVEYGVPPSACDDLQTELEKFAGLNFTAGSPEMSDEQLYGSLFLYFKRALSQKAVSVFAKYGVLADIDVSELDIALPEEDSTDDFLPYASGTALRTEEVDAKRLLEKIISLMERLEQEKDTKYNQKDHLLSQVIRTARATGEFLSCYYASLQARRSVWRPVAFSYQVWYAHDRGAQYLKNPAFVQSCGHMAIGGMIGELVHVGQSAGLGQAALDGMYAISGRVSEEKIRDTALLGCADGPEQIGKALSKELRTKEAKYSLAKALLTSALDRSRADDLSPWKGGECHE